MDGLSTDSFRQLRSVVEPAVQAGETAWGNVDAEQAQTWLITLVLYLVVFMLAGVGIAAFPAGQADAGGVLSLLLTS
jgi:hypothetical protein